MGDHLTQAILVKVSSTITTHHHYCNLLLHSIHIVLATLHTAPLPAPLPAPLGLLQHIRGGHGVPPLKCSGGGNAVPAYAKKLKGHQLRLHCSEAPPQVTPVQWYKGVWMVCVHRMCILCVYMA